MTHTPAQQSLYAATNEFFRDHADRHGNSQASRDEATDFVVRAEKTVADVVALVRKHTAPEQQHDQATEIACMIIDAEPYLVGRMVDVQMEGVK